MGRNKKHHSQNNPSAKPNAANAEKVELEVEPIPKNLQLEAKNKTASRLSKIEKEDLFERFCELCTKGYTEEAISKKLGLKIGTLFYFCARDAGLKDVHIGMNKDCLVCAGHELSKDVKATLKVPFDAEYIKFEQANGTWRIADYK